MFKGPKHIPGIPGTQVWILACGEGWVDLHAAERKCHRGAGAEVRRGYERDRQTYGCSRRVRLLQGRAEQRDSCYRCRYVSRALAAAVRDAGDAVPCEYHQEERLAGMV